MFFIARAPSPLRPKWLLTPEFPARTAHRGQLSLIPSSRRCRRRPWIETTPFPPAPRRHRRRTRCMSEISAVVHRDRTLGDQPLEHHKIVARLHPVSASNAETSSASVCPGLCQSVFISFHSPSDSLRCSISQCSLQNANVCYVLRIPQILTLVNCNRYILCTKA